jgi:hypothetical protein
MNEKPRLDHDVYIENRGKFLPEDLLPYAEEWVAWSLDGSRIVAHHPDFMEVTRMLEAAGINWQEEVNYEWIPPGGEIESLL